MIPVSFDNIFKWIQRHLNIQSIETLGLLNIFSNIVSLFIFKRVPKDNDIWVITNYDNINTKCLNES